MILKTKKIILFQAPQSQGTATSLNALHLGAIIIELKLKADQMIEAKQNPEHSETYQLSLERLAQSIQLALASRSIAGNISQVLCRLETLPQNLLLQIVIKTHKDRI